MRCDVSQLLMVALLHATCALAAQPNILFMVGDDTNYYIDYLHTVPRSFTPNLDRLAERGVMFTRAIAAAPVCNPARTSLMWGNYPDKTGLYDNGEDVESDAILADQTHLPDHFRNNGYYTAHAARLFHAEKSEYWDQGMPSPADGPYLNLNQLDEPLFDFGTDPEFGTGSYNQDVGATDSAIDFLQRLPDAQTKPVFLGVGLGGTHLPWYVPPEWLATLEERVGPVGSWLPERPPNDLNDTGRGDGHIYIMGKTFYSKTIQAGTYGDAVWHYLASVVGQDTQVGRLLDAVDATGLDWIIVYTSDQGQHTGTKERFGKLTLYRDTTQVPLIISVPGGLKNKTYDSPVSQAEIYGTLSALAGLPTPPSFVLPGFEAAVVNLAATNGAGKRTVMFRGEAAIMTQRWDYIEWADGSEELYDLAVDPLSIVNLADNPAFAEAKACLKAQLPPVEQYAPYTKPVQTFFPNPDGGTTGTGNGPPATTSCDEFNAPPSSPSPPSQPASSPSPAGGDTSGASPSPPADSPSPPAKSPSSPSNSPSPSSKSPAASSQSPSPNSQSASPTTSPPTDAAPLAASTTSPSSSLALDATAPDPPQQGDTSGARAVTAGVLTAVAAASVAGTVLWCGVRGHHCGACLGGRSRGAMKYKRVSGDSKWPTIEDRHLQHI